MPFSTFRKVHVEDLKAGDRIWFSDAMCVVIGVEPEKDPAFSECFRVYTEEPTSSGRDYIYAFPDHEFLAPRVGQSDASFIQEVSNALAIMAERNAEMAQETAGGDSYAEGLTPE